MDGTDTTVHDYIRIYVHGKIIKYSFIAPLVHSLCIHDAHVGFWAPLMNGREGTGQNGTWIIKPVHKNMRKKKHEMPAQFIHLFSHFLKSHLQNEKKKPKFTRIKFQTPLAIHNDSNKKISSWNFDFDSDSNLEFLLVFHLFYSFKFNCHNTQKFSLLFYSGYEFVILKCQTECGCIMQVKQIQNVLLFVVISFVE